MCSLFDIRVNGVATATAWHWHNAEKCFAAIRIRQWQQSSGHYFLRQTQFHSHTLLTAHKIESKLFWFCWVEWMHAPAHRILRHAKILRAAIFPIFNKLNAGADWVRQWLSIFSSSRHSMCTDCAAEWCDRTENTGDNITFGRICHGNESKCYVHCTSSSSGSNPLFFVICIYWK